MNSQVSVLSSLIFSAFSAGLKKREADAAIRDHIKSITDKPALLAALSEYAIEYSQLAGLDAASEKITKAGYKKAVDKLLASNDADLIAAYWIGYNAQRALIADKVQKWISRGTIALLDDGESLSIRRSDADIKAGIDHGFTVSKKQQHANKGKAKTADVKKDVTGAPVAETAPHNKPASAASSDLSGVQDAPVAVSDVDPLALWDRYGENLQSLAINNPAVTPEMIREFAAMLENIATAKASPAKATKDSNKKAA